MRQLVVVVLAVAVAAGASGAAAGTKAPTQGPPESSDSTFVLGVQAGYLDSINPIASASSDPQTAIYPKLCQLAGNLTTVLPDFATSWKISNGGRTWTWQTRRNAVWSDGKPMTARDAATSIMRYKKYEAVGGAGRFGTKIKGIVSATAPNRNTLVTRYDKPLAPGIVLSNLCATIILPNHVWSQQTGDSGRQLLKFSNSPTVSGGAFGVRSFSKDTAVLPRNDKFYAGKARVKLFGLKSFSSPDAMVAALKSGEIDMAREVDALAAGALKKDKNIQLKVGPLFQQDNFTINDRGPLKDIKVREAVDLAINRANIARTLYGPYGRAWRGILPPLGPWHSNAIKSTFDPTAAGRILDNAGWTAGSDGVRAREGTKLSFDIIYLTQLPQHQRVAELIKNDLKRVGINVTVVPQDVNAGITTVSKTEDWDMFLITGSFYVDPDQQLNSNICGGGLNWYCNRRYDAMVVQQRNQTNEKKRVAAVHRVEEYLANQHQVLNVAIHGSVVAWRTGWRGITLMPDGPFSYFGNLTPLNVYKP